MKTLTSFLCLGFALVQTLEATVVVYKGVNKRTRSFAPTSIVPAKVVGYHLLVDFNAERAAHVMTFTADGQRKYAAIGPFNVRMGLPSLAGGKTATLLVNGLTVDNSQTDWNFDLFSWMGTNATFVVKKSPNPEQITAPRVFAGSAQSLYRQGDKTNFFLQRISAVLQPGPTVKVNDAGRTLDEAFQDLVEQLQAKGYKSAF